MTKKKTKETEKITTTRLKILSQIYNTAFLMNAINLLYMKLGCRRQLCTSLGKNVNFINLFSSICIFVFNELPLFDSMN